MKKIIFLLTLFILTISVNAQQYVTVYDESIHQNKIVPYIAGVTNVTTTSGFTKVQQDSLVTVLKNFTNTSVSTLQTWATNTFALKGTSTGGTSSTGSNLKFSGDGYVIEMLPANYNPALNQGKFNLVLQEFKGVNAPDPRSNVVMSLGYNINSGAGEEIVGEGTFRDGWESYYIAGGILYERHVAAFKKRGSTAGEIRPLSFYINSVNGQLAVNSQSDQWNWKLASNGNWDWASLIHDASGNVRFTLNPDKGNVDLSFSNSGGTITSYPGGIGYPGGMDFLLPAGKFSFNKPISGKDGGGLSFLFNENGLGSTFKVVNGNGNIKVFEATKDGINTGGATMKFDIDLATGNLLVTANGVTRTYKPQ